MQASLEVEEQIILIKRILLNYIIEFFAFYHTMILECVTFRNLKSLICKKLKVFGSMRIISTIHIMQLLQYKLESNNAHTVDWTNL